MKCRNTSRTAIPLVAICLLILGLSVAFGSESAGILKATPDFHDFGTIDEGQPAAITVIVQNIGSTPVEITNVKTS
jgi:hypothetical protein